MHVGLSRNNSCRQACSSARQLYHYNTHINASLFVLSLSCCCHRL